MPINLPNASNPTGLVQLQNMLSDAEEYLRTLTSYIRDDDLQDKLDVLAGTYTEVLMFKCRVQARMQPRRKT